MKFFLMIYFLFSKVGVVLNYLLINEMACFHISTIKFYNCKCHEYRSLHCVISKTNSEKKMILHERYSFFCKLLG